MGVPVYLRMLSKHAGQSPGWRSKCWADRTHSSSCQRGAGGINPCQVLGQAAAAREEGVLWCAHMELFWMPRNVGLCPRGAQRNMCLSMCTVCTTPRVESQALLSISCGTQPELCVTPGPVPAQDKLQGSLMPGDCCLLAACTRGSPQKAAVLAQGHPQSRRHPQGTGHCQLC